MHLHTVIVFSFFRKRCLHDVFFKRVDILQKRETICVIRVVNLIYYKVTLHYYIGIWIYYRSYNNEHHYLFSIV